MLANWTNDSTRDASYLDLDVSLENFVFLWTITYYVQICCGVFLNLLFTCLCYVTKAKDTDKFFKFFKFSDLSFIADSCSLSCGSTIVDNKRIVGFATVIMQSLRVHRTFMCRCNFQQFGRHCLGSTQKHFTTFCLSI